MPQPSLDKPTALCGAARGAIMIGSCALPIGTGTLLIIRGTSSVSVASANYLTCFNWFLDS